MMSLDHESPIINKWTEVFILENLSVWGSFSLVVVLLGVIIWWLLYTNRIQREAFLKVIAEERLERKEWQATAFTQLKAESEKLHASLQAAREIASFAKGLAKQSAGDTE